MRYAIVSDIHGNLQAWNTVLSDAALRGAGRVLCLGDVVVTQTEHLCIMRKALWAPASTPCSGST